VKQTLVKMGYALPVLAAGLAMILAGIERTQLISSAADREGSEAVIPGSVYILLIVGVFLLNLAVFSGLTIWSHRLRAHPETRQAPAWVLVVAIVAAGGLGLAGYAAHSGDIDSLDVVPSNVNWGFIAVETLLGTVVIVALILLGARWTPRHQPARARH
jgi:uncharacterized membrane protein YidH (DUF202 family)